MGRPSELPAPMPAVMTWLVAWLSVACGGDPTTTGEDTPRAPVVYVGTVQNTDARFAVARDDARFVAYVCGGPLTLTRLTTWLEGGMLPGAPDRAGASSEGTSIDLTFDGDGLVGQLDVSGEVFDVAAEQIHAESSSGLFQRVDRGCRTGLIVPPSGQGEPQGAHCAELDASGDAIPRAYQQVTPILPVTLTERGIRVQLALEDRSLYVLPVVVPLPR